MGHTTLACRFVPDGLLHSVRKARLARIEYGSEERDDAVLYLIYAEVPGMPEHSQHDRDPRFNAFLEKARQLQPEPPSVFGGDILFERGP